MKSYNLWQYGYIWKSCQVKGTERQMLHDCMLVWNLWTLTVQRQTIEESLSEASENRRRKVHQWVVSYNYRNSSGVFCPVWWLLIKINVLYFTIRNKSYGNTLWLSINMCNFVASKKFKTWNFQDRKYQV